MNSFIVEMNMKNYHANPNLNVCEVPWLDEFNVSKEEICPK